MIGVFKNIFSFEERVDRKIQFWTLLGPIFLILSLSLAQTPLLVVTLFSVLLCWKYPAKGLTLSLFLLIVYISYNHMIVLSDRHMWNLGLESSIALGLAITSFSFDYMSTFIESFKGDLHDTIKELQEKVANKESKGKQLADELQSNIEHLKNDLEEKRDEMAALHSLNDTLKKSADENLKGKEALVFEVVQKERKIQELETAIDELQEKLAFLKDEEFLKDNNQELVELLNTAKVETNAANFKSEDLLKQLSVERQRRESIEKNPNQDQSAIIENLSKELELAKTQIEELNTKSTTASSTEEMEIIQQKLKEKNSLLMSYEKKFSELNKAQSLFLQLKDQFDEKNNVLHQTRTELFHIREELIAYKRDQKKDLEDLSENEKLLVQDLNKSQEEVAVFEEENDNLKNIVSSLNEKIAASNKEDAIEEA